MQASMIHLWGKSTTLEKRNYMERIEAHIYSEVSLPIQKCKIPNPIWKNLSIFKAFPSRAYRFISILKQPQSHDNNQMKLVGFSYQ